MACLFLYFCYLGAGGVGTDVGAGIGVGAAPTGRPAPPPLSLDSRCTIPPAHAWSRRHPLGVVGEPAAGRIPSGPSVGGWSRLGASSRLQSGRWDRRQCHMPDFWVTGRPRNPLNASVATFCAAGVISMHQTPPGMVRGVSGVSRGRFVTISTGSHSEELSSNRCTSGVLSDTGCSDDVVQ